MKKLLGLSLLAAAFAGSGCYRTEEGHHKFGTPWGRDTIESRYERPVEQVYQAARDTLAFNGTPTGDNTIAHTLAGSIDNRTIWIKVDEVQPGVSRIFVQARKSGGRPDIYLASELDKQIGMKLQSMPPVPAR